jgi:Cap4 SAVED domain
MGSGGGFPQFVETARVQLTWEGLTCVRAVLQSEIVRVSPLSNQLDGYMAGVVPYYYRDPADIARSIPESLFTTAIRDTLSRLPKAESFRESHFGEIMAGVFAEEMLGLRLLYSKLSLLSTENANANKMDLVLYDPRDEPIEFVLAEVKSSPKHSTDGLPAGHDKSCFASLFRSLRDYHEDDQSFDLAVAKDRLSRVPEEDRARVRAALDPYSGSKVRYAGFCVIDTSTRDRDEASVLATRESSKEFDVDLLCVAELPHVIETVYRHLERLKKDVVLGS